MRRPSAVPQNPYHGVHFRIETDVFKKAKIILIEKDIKWTQVLSPFLKKIVETNGENLRDIFPELFEEK